MGWLAPILGVIGSLFRGKKTQQVPQQTPEQLARSRMLWGQGQNAMSPYAANKQPTYDAMNMIARIFGGGMGQYGPQQQMGQQGPPPTNPIISDIFRGQPRV